MQPGNEFKKFLQEARKDREVADYLDSFSVAIGNIVLERRTSLGWTQGELAEKSGMSLMEVSQIEAGFGSIMLESLNPVFATLGFERLDSFSREEAESNG